MIIYKCDRCNKILDTHPNAGKYTINEHVNNYPFTRTLCDSCLQSLETWMENPESFSKKYAVTVTLTHRKNHVRLTFTDISASCSGEAIIIVEKRINGMQAFRGRWDKSFIVEEVVSYDQT